MTLAGLEVQSIVLIFLALSLGSLTKGVVGFGLPLVAIPLLAGFLGVEHAVTILALPNLLTNSWMMWTNRAHASRTSWLWPLLISGFLGVVLGTWLLTELSGMALVLVLAAGLAIYLGVLIFHPELEISESAARRLAPVVGAVAGTTQGAMGLSAPVVATYFHALKLDRKTHVFTIVCMFQTMSVVQLVSLYEFGLLTGERMMESAFAMIPIVLVLPLGIRLGRIISRQTFNRILITLLVLIEARLLYQGLFAG